MILNLQKIELPQKSDDAARVTFLRNFIRIRS